MHVAMTLLSIALSMQGTDAPNASAERAQWLHRGVQVGSTYYPVALFVPSLPAPSDGYPVLLFLHGSGERGDDGEAQTRSGLGPYLGAHGEEFPAITVFPQAPADSDWSGDQSAAALAAIELVEQEFAVDADRIYLRACRAVVTGCAKWPCVRRMALPRCCPSASPQRHHVLVLLRVQRELPAADQP